MCNKIFPLHAQHDLSFHSLLPLLSISLLPPSLPLSPPLPFSITQQVPPIQKAFNDTLV